VKTVDVKNLTETDLPHTLGRSLMNKIIYIGMDVHSTNFTLCRILHWKERLIWLHNINPVLIL